MTSGHDGHTPIDAPADSPETGRFEQPDGVRTVSNLEAAAFLGVTDRQVRRLVHSGQLQGTGDGRVTVASVERRAGRSMSVPAPAENNERMVYVSADYIEGLVLQAAAGRDAATRLLEYRDRENQEAERAAKLAAEVEQLRAELAKVPTGFWTKSRRLWPW